MALSVLGSAAGAHNEGARVIATALAVVPAQSVAADQTRLPGDNPPPADDKPPKP